MSELDMDFIEKNQLIVHATSLPMGVYGTSTWHQGTSPTPPAHPVASSSSCTAIPTVSVSPVQRRSLGMENNRHRKSH